MTTAKAIKSAETAFDKIYDSLYALQDTLDRLEDEELDSLVTEFIDQIELQLLEGDVNFSIIRERIEELNEFE